MEKAPTEQSNIKSVEIDISTPEGMVEIFEKIDLAKFSNEVNGEPGILHESMLSQMSTCSERINKLCKSQRQGVSFKIVISGCGTSGRIGFLINHIYNKYTYTKDLFGFCMAGGVRALFASQEGPEDDPIRGKKDLIAATKENHCVIFIGISCGLSAPYVAGQLLHCMQSTHSILPIVIGFNPVSFAREKILQDDTEETFKSILLQMSKKKHCCYILNPVVGAEVITGSTRMKGGTATFIMLNAIIISSLATNMCGKQFGIHHLVAMQQECIASTYRKSKNMLSALLRLCGRSIRNGGNVYYLGLDHLGLVGFFDAAECVPTFGADVNDFRAFIQNGIMPYFNENSNCGTNLDDFLDQFGHTLKSVDTVIFLRSIGTWSTCPDNVLTLIKEKSPNVAFIEIGVDSDSTLNISVTVSIEFDMNVISKKLTTTSLGDTSRDNFSAMINESLSFLSIKIILNVISTGAFVLAGKVYENLMIDIKLTNSKLFERGVLLVQKICGKDRHLCERNIFKAMYRTETISHDIELKTIEEHTIYAQNIDKIIPLAVVMTSLDCTLDRAELIIESHENIRSCISSVLKK